MKRTKSYHKSLIRDLKDPVEAAEYINAALEEGDVRQLLVSLRNVAEAQGGLTRIARRARLNRGNLYRILSKRGNPEIHSLENILNLFGLRMAVVANHGHQCHHVAA